MPVPIDMPASAPERISIRQLHCLLRVAESGAVSRAAPALARTQTAVTKAIATLERQLGVRLFERHRDGVSLTPAGGILARRTRALFDEFGLARERLAERGLRRGTPSAAEFAANLGNSRLRAFLSVFSKRDIRNAAGALGLSATAIRKSLRELEMLAGVPLFAHLPGGVLAPTPAAEHLARHAKMAFAEIRIALEELHALAGGALGQVVVGSVPFVRTGLLPAALAAFARENPQVRIATREASYEDLETALRSGEIDFIVGPLNRPQAVDDVDALPYVPAPLGVVVRAGHRFAATGRLDADAIGVLGWVMPPPNTPSRVSFERLLERRAVALPTRIVETSSYAIRRGLLLASDFAAVSPLAEFRHELDAGALIPLELDFATADDRATFANPSYIVTRRRSAMSPAAAALLAHVIGPRSPRGPDADVAGSDPDPRSSGSGPDPA